MCSDRAVLAFSRGVGIHFLAPHHEIHEPLQIFKKSVSRHRLKVLEKLLARSGRGANHLVARIGHFQKRVQAEGQQVHGQQQAGEMFFAVAKVVFKMIALGLENVIVLVLDLPPGPASGDQPADSIAVISQSVMKEFR